MNLMNLIRFACDAEPFGSRRPGAALALACLLVGSAAAGATTYSWTGQAPAPNNQTWAEPQNWSPVGVPASGDSAMIGSPTQGYTVALQSGVEVSSLTVIGSTLEVGASLTVDASLSLRNATLASGGLVTVNGGLTVAPRSLMNPITDLACPMVLNGSSLVAETAVLKFISPVAITKPRQDLLR